MTEIPVELKEYFESVSIEEGISIDEAMRRDSETMKQINALGIMPGQFAKWVNLQQRKAGDPCSKS